MSWTKDKVKKLEVLWYRGSTVAQIAKVLGYETRNAVISKAKRLGLLRKLSLEDRQDLLKAMSDNNPADPLIQVYTERGIGIDKILQFAKANGFVLDQKQKLFVPEVAPENPTKPDLDQPKIRYSSVRDGQTKFRLEILEKYKWKCAISQTEQIEVLLAAHINPYSNIQAHHTSNGIVLRADLHLLFDRGLIGIAANTFEVALSPYMQDGTYRNIEGAKVNLPDLPEDYPSAAALRWHMENIFKK